MRRKPPIQRSLALALAIFSTLCILALPAMSQEHQQATGDGPTVIFRLVNKQTHPKRYEVTVHADGSGQYESQDEEPAVSSYPSQNPAYQKQPSQEEIESNSSSDIKGDIYRRSFQVSPAVKSKIFDLAKAANYFDGDFDFRKHAIAFTGSKTLVYSDKGHSTQTTYNWSENQAIEELTGIFARISQTFESGQRLAFEYRFDKLGLDQELAGMEEMAAHGGLAEMHVLLPLLKQLANDRSILHVAQERAQKLMKIAAQEEEQIQAAGPSLNR